MIQQKMDKKAYFLGMMNGERLLGELLVSFWCMCENCEFIKTPAYSQTLVGKKIVMFVLMIYFINHYNAHFHM